MINFHASIDWPSNYWKILFSKTLQLSKHKFLEISAYQNSTIVEISFIFNIKCDHAGTKFGLCILGHQIEFTVYDCRHWDDEKNCWENHEQPTKNK